MRFLTMNMYTIITTTTMTTTNTPYDSEANKFVLGMDLLDRVPVPVPEEDENVNVDEIVSDSLNIFDSVNVKVGQGRHPLIVVP